MYAGAGLSESPYSHLLAPSHWAEIEDLFLRDACALMGLAVESPLAVAVNAGCVALPALLNIKQVMLQVREKFLCSVYGLKRKVTRNNPYWDELIN